MNEAARAPLMVEDPEAPRGRRLPRPSLGQDRLPEIAPKGINHRERCGPHLGLVSGLFGVCRPLQLKNPGM